MEKKQYVAITIGPILDTMGMVSSPAALWASSYMFSYISKRICEMLVEDNNVPFGNIIVPVYDEDLLTLTDGVGLMHDRVIFEKPDTFRFPEDMCKIRDKVLDEVNILFQLNDISFVKQYVMIRGLQFGAENPILESGRKLDSLELASAFVRKEKRNPLLSLYTGSDERRNVWIKDTAKNYLGVDPAQWQLLTHDRQTGSSEGYIRDLAAIANVAGVPKKGRLKKFNYYAVLRSDGDNVSKIIAGLKDKGEFHDFSRACLSYCRKISKAVGDYGGMTVYAGGDDLLALMPCENGKGETIFDFVKTANKIFSESFATFIGKIEDENGKITDPDKKLPVPSLSFGITLCHVKHPLFEALADSAHLLFDISKDDANKDCVTLRLIKHSGQQTTVLIPNDKLDLIIDLLNTVRKPKKGGDNSQDNEEILLSALYKVEAFNKLFDSVEKEQTDDLFMNIFDAVAHEDNDFVHDKLPCIMIATYADKPISNTDDKDSKHSAALSAVIRIVKFFVEKTDEKEKTEKEEETE